MRRISCASVSTGRGSSIQSQRANRLPSSGTISTLPSPPPNGTSTSWLSRVSIAMSAAPMMDAANSGGCILRVASMNESPTSNPQVRTLSGVCTRYRWRAPSMIPANIPASPVRWFRATNLARGCATCPHTQAAMYVAGGGSSRGRNVCRASVMSLQHFCNVGGPST